MTYTYEIFLRHGQVGKIEWDAFLRQIAEYLGGIASWEIFIARDQNVIHYYLRVDKNISASFGLADFLLKPSDFAPPSIKTSHHHGLYSNKWSDNFVTILQNLRKHQYQLSYAVISLKTFKKTLTGSIRIYYRRGERNFRERLILFSPNTFLSIDFAKEKSFIFKKFPKYLKLEKVTQLLSEDSTGALFEIDPFPYLESAQYLRHDSYDFAKHSLIIGGSGSGKSRFLSSLIDKIYQSNSSDYKVIVIDPHDALYRDCAQISSRSVINFQNLTNSIDLFQCRTEDINASVELMLSLFHSLMNDSYNGRLERVLRYTVYLLIVAHEFSFLTLRKVLLDLEYRNAVIAKHQDQLPVSVSHFFLTDFNELKSQNYNDAIAPIIAFIDEMQMVPVFNSEERLPNLATKVQDNFLNIFSLNRLKLGDKVVQTIAGLLMQQLFLLSEQPHDAHLIIIIDEVSVVENPIIARFLSELRKYRASVILAGQYFDQISPNLRSAIFSNTSNYYLFRVSQSDASLLTKNLKIKVENSQEPEDQVNLLTGLKLRECLVQVSAHDELLPIFKARTTDFDSTATTLSLASAIAHESPVETVQKENILEQTFTFPNLQKSFSENTPSKTHENPLLKNKQIFSQDKTPPKAFNFEINPDISFENIKNNYSTSRKRKETNK